MNKFSKSKNCFSLKLENPGNSKEIFFQAIVNFLASEKVAISYLALNDIIIANKDKELYWEKYKMISDLIGEVNYDFDKIRKIVFKGNFSGELYYNISFDFSDISEFLITFSSKHDGSFIEQFYYEMRDRINFLLHNLGYSMLNL